MYLLLYITVVCSVCVCVLASFIYISCAVPNDKEIQDKSNLNKEQRKLTIFHGLKAIL